MTAPEVSHGRGGAGNINPDNTKYVDGEVVRVGAEGSQGDGAFSTGRGGTCELSAEFLPAERQRHQIPSQTSIQHTSATSLKEMPGQRYHAPQLHTTPPPPHCQCQASAGDKRAPCLTPAVLKTTFSPANTTLTSNNRRSQHRRRGRQEAGSPRRQGSRARGRSPAQQGRRRLPHGPRRRWQRAHRQEAVPGQGGWWGAGWAGG